MKFVLLASIAAVALPVSAAAQSGMTLPVLVVSPTLVPTPENQIASSVTVITGEQIQNNQQRTIVDVLKAVPGLNVVQAGGPGGLTSVFIRGTESRHVKVMIDGIDVSDPSNPGRLYDFAHLQTYDIERVEVLRGPQSGLYGSDAIGGVISVTTKKGEGPAKARAMVEGGSFQTFNQAGGLSGSFDRFNYAFNVSHYKVGDNPVMPKRFVQPGQPYLSNEYENTTASTRLGANITENFSVDYVARYTESTLDLVDLTFPPPTFAARAANVHSLGETRQFYTRGEALWKLFDGRFRNRFGAAYTDVWNASRFTSGPTVSTNTGTRDRYNWLSEFDVAPGHVLLGGVDFQTDRLKTSTNINRSVDNTGAFVEMQSSFWQRFFIVANARFDDNETFGQHTTWRVAPAVIVPGTETKFKATAGTGFRAPSLNQLYVNFPPTFFSNPNLQPETSFGYDVGFEQPIQAVNARFGVTYFRNDLENLIASTGCGFILGCTTLTNIAKARTSGIEAFVQWAMTERLSVRFDHTYTDTIDETTKLDLLRRPKHKSSFQSTWQPIDPLTLTTTVIWVGEWYDGDRVTFSRVQQPGYTVFNFAANYAVNQYATVFARLENAFGEYYEVPNGYRAPGFGVFGGIRVQNRE